MNLKNVLPGKNIPHDIYVIIEIPYLSHPIKYEIDKKTHALFVDRFIPTSMLYPCNYGYINNTLSSDGDPLDVLIPIEFPLQYSSVIKCKPIGILNMIDESGLDNKIIAVPHHDICKNYKYIEDINDVSIITKEKILHFFEHYKDLEKNKWVKIIGFENKEIAKLEIERCVQKHRNKKSI